MSSLITVCAIVSSLSLSLTQGQEPQVCVLCPGKDVGLVRFPPTPAPNLSVETSCADNASPSSGSGLFVECLLNGRWSTGDPVCICNRGYSEVTPDISEPDKTICQAIPVCRAETRQLVVYPATDAPNVVTAECAGNAYLLRNSLSVLCLWYGSWSTDNAPVCACNNGYFISSEGICKAIPSCPERTLGLVHYPTTLAPTGTSKTVYVSCADNAHVRSGYSLRVLCTTDGTWEYTRRPECDCDTGYRINTANERHKCEALRRCPAKSEGLVRYPSTQAPVSGSDAVTTQCADNAHVSRGSSLSSAVCMSDGTWSGRIPQCDCDNGYYKINTERGRTICSAVPTCQGKTERLVYYPTTIAPSSGSNSVNTSCADNAHQVTPSLEVLCHSDGRWSTNTQPQCRCNDGYQQATVKGKLICQAIVCPEKSEALVYYPTTFGNEWAEIRCADHAHKITIEDSVLCDSNGDWSNQSPECQCDSGYRQTTGNGRQICEAIPSCPAKSEGLVHYPTTLAPDSGSVIVTTHCADNAHIASGSSLRVLCDSDGTWSGGTPLCECDDGYRPVPFKHREICEAIVCPVKSVGLVRYPATFGGSTAMLFCADNAYSNSTNTSVLCGSTGVWSGETQPQCVCDDEYRVRTENGENTCEAIPSCPAKSEGLVHYPTTLSLHSGSLDVTTHCADNAHTTSSSMNVTCNYDGTWSGAIPWCECDTEYYEATFHMRQICVALPPKMCEAMSEGLARYPNWLADYVEPVTVTTRCADNAHVRAGYSLNVTCTSSGNWSGVVPQCDCDSGHHVTTTDDGTEICQGDNPIFSMISMATLSGESLLLIIIVTTLLVLCLCKQKFCAKRRKSSIKAPSNKLWVHGHENFSNPLVTSAFGGSGTSSKDGDSTRDDDVDDDLSPVPQPPAKFMSEIFRARDNLFGAIDSDIVVPTQTFVMVEKEPVNLTGEPVNTTQGDVRQKVEPYETQEKEKEKEIDRCDFAENLETDREGNDDEIAASQGVPVDMESVEEIYVEIPNRIPERVSIASGEDTEWDTEWEDTEYEDDDTTAQSEATPATYQDSAQAENYYDDISMHRKIKKPKNIDDVEEIYDIVVNQLASRKDSVVSRPMPYAVCTLPVTSPVCVGTNEAYEVREEVHVCTNEAYTATEDTTCDDSASYI